MMGKIKMWAQSIAIVSLLVAAANGIPPVSNFGWSLPTFRFWEVAEVRQAFSHLAGFSLTSDHWRVFGYLVGRGALWVAVLTAFWSMFDYFRFFFAENKKRKSAAARIVPNEHPADP
jgi:hypothetical protein